ncbi:MAG: hypothetical protein KUF82_13250 [Candidatus Thiodiazotropha sp. (ex Ctena orbiculata)]|nr:hypothetical protein [Candidatus Thiodiazotropha taylori]
MHNEWPGSRWWKFDFHTHTPASKDYKGNGDISPEDWLELYLNAGIHCVVVTDHNSGGWIDCLQEKLNSLKESDADKWSEFEIFPGVELSCNGGVHILAILDPSNVGADIEALIGSVGYQGSRGDSDGVTNSSVEDVIDKVHQVGGVVCAAHIDMPKGLIKSITDHNTLQPIFEKLDALEIIDLEADVLDSHKEKIDALATVIGSDSHKPADIGRAFTWVKMSKPTIEGLRLALLDPELSIYRSDLQQDMPLRSPEQWIESISLKDMHLLRTKPLTLTFNPSYNALIGGRGSGKSTVIKCLRLSLARDKELEALTDSPEIAKTFRAFKQSYTPASKIGMMLADSELSIGVNKGVDDLQEQYKYVWKNNEQAEENGLDVFRWEDDKWEHTNLNREQARDVFPVKIFSQKQILALANNPQALLEYIDSSIPDLKLEWQNEFDANKQKLLDERAKLQAQKKELEKKPALENEYKEARRKARVFSNDTFGELLKAYKRATTQKNKLNEYYSGLEDKINILNDAIDEIDGFNGKNIDAFEEVTEAEKAIKAEAESLGKSLKEQYDNLVKEVAAMKSELDAAKTQVAESDWENENNAHITAYQNETARLKAAGIDSAKAASEAVANEARLSEQLAHLRKIEEQISDTEDAVTKAEESLLVCREQLTEIRQKFIAELFAHNDMLKVMLRSMADSRGSVDKFREILRIPNTSQFSEIYQDDEEIGGQRSGILWDMVDPAHAGSTVGERLSEIKKALEEGSKDVLKTTLHGSLVKRLKSLPIEAFNELSHWFPEDEVQLEYRPAKGRSYKSIAQASAGQKTAAILSFLLIHGNEPLILDQPEDDLDNALVSELVVEQLRENKKHRQLIIVTHNANVVVNADAELVTTMDFTGGQIVSNNSGGLQERRTREDICRIMEGGHEAFRQRYKRILKDLETVV